MKNGRRYRRRRIGVQREAVTISSFSPDWSMPDCLRIYMRGTANIDGDVREIVFALLQSHARETAVALVDALAKAKGPGVHCYKDALREASEALHRKAVRHPNQVNARPWSKVKAKREKP